MANNGLSGHVATTSALPPTADLRVSMSAFTPVPSASPSGADLRNDVAVLPLVTQSGPYGELRNIGRPAGFDELAHVVPATPCHAGDVPVQAYSGGATERAIKHLGRAAHVAIEFDEGRSGAGGPATYYTAA